MQGTSQHSLLPRKPYNSSGPQRAPSRYLSQGAPLYSLLLGTLKSTYPTLLIILSLKLGQVWGTPAILFIIFVGLINEYLEFHKRLFILFIFFFNLGWVQGSLAAPAESLIGDILTLEQRRGHKIFPTLQGGHHNVNHHQGRFHPPSGPPLLPPSSSRFPWGEPQKSLPSGTSWLPSEQHGGLLLLRQISPPCQSLHHAGSLHSAGSLHCSGPLNNAGSPHRARSLHYAVALHHARIFPPSLLFHRSTVMSDMSPS